MFEIEQKQHQEKKKLIQKKLSEQAAEYQTVTRCSSADGELIPRIEKLKLGGYNSNVQIAIDYANRQMREKIKTEMLAKMDKLQSKVK